MRKIVALPLVLAVFLGSIMVGAYIRETFYPKIDYQIEEPPLVVAYTVEPLDFGVLWVGTSYEHNDTATQAIQVKREGNLTVGLYSINASHFTEFTVEIWNVTASPYTLVGSFNLTNRRLSFTTGSANYSYLFYFTVAADAPYGASGTIELEVFLENI